MAEEEWPTWSEVWDPASEANYYYHNTTGECVWEKPADFVPAAKPDDGSSVLYPPTLRAAMLIQSVIRAKKARIKLRLQRVQNQAEAEEGPAKKWVAALDPSSGSYYFVNMETEECVWDQPAARAPALCWRCERRPWRA